MSSQSSVPTWTLASDPGMKYAPVEEQVEEAGDVAKSVAEPRNLYEFRVWNIPRPTATNRVTFGARETIYYRPGDEAMYAIVRRYLDRVQWIERMAWNNQTDADQRYEYYWSTGLTITEGKEVTNGFSLGATYEGMSIGVDHSSRTFKSTETTSTWGETLIITVPRRSELIFYQKRFDFTDVILFVNDAWGKEWNIGSWGSYAPLATKITAVQIMAEEYFTRDGRLPEGPGTATADTVPHIIPPSYVRKREDVTQRARNVLADMGL
ncbi:hypothetical protein B0H16DRAFT_1468993 [Mycena metata]|uniref:Uncharacterized protein n=1 Tax=Mycena metata TaxID=1033252 RepID=A0AAD7MSS9_9AGAR|nr:hypothetical protein B0H16DRAFT_1468993 [Mycena metata]